ncbi:MAG: hypothetical protein JO236_15140 [Mycobacterium sp.]|uniref:hypothetical protein n=1 Tax=Mycobacterium sp. TaxID=1785 RepID=UPI001EB5A6B1|nr:hypothetical protein [Mycobacterium sp.]MBW0018864.1 hypothetical protein [Mycobacterium sp.]
MQQTLASIVAVLGTCLGSYLAYLFTRRTAERTTIENRREKRRQEFAEAVADFASKAALLRRAEFNRGKKRINNEAREEARDEVQRLRADTRAAYYVMRLYADPVTDQDFCRQAKDVMTLSRRISACPDTEDDMRDLERAAEAAVEQLIDAASTRLRSGMKP